MANIYNIYGEAIDISIETDKTLNKEGYAADAKTVGDKITVMNNHFTLDNHSWSVMGDSISSDNAYVNKQYWDFISERYSNMEIYNYGISAQRISHFTARYQNMHYSDIITVFGGVNDWGQTDPTPMGEISDDTTSTFYGSLNILCNGLVTTFPKSLLMFITPLGGNGFNAFPADKNSLGLDVYDYAEAIKIVCSKFKIPVVDACSNSLLNPQIPALKSLYFHDGLHLNILGHQVLSRMIEAELLSHYIPSIQQS